MDLYVKLLEQVALAYEVPCFAIYTEADLILKIRRKREEWDQQGTKRPELDAFFA